MYIFFVHHLDQRNSLKSTQLELGAAKAVSAPLHPTKQNNSRF